MASFSDLRNNIKQLIIALPGFAQDEGNDRLLDGVGIVRVRSIREGINVDGIEGNRAEYSDNKISTARAKDKTINGAGEAFVNKNRLATWYEIRQAQGLTNRYVNLAYTLRMWNSLRVISGSYSDGHYRAIAGTTDALVLTYIGQLRKKYGNFLEPTDSEKSYQVNKAGENFYTFIGTYLR